jgi:uncharacterized membrane protein
LNHAKTLATVWLFSCWASLSLPSHAQSKVGDSSTVPPTTAGEWDVDLIDNSDTLSQAIAINRSGAVIGVREKANADHTVFSMVYFFCDDKGSRDIPILEGYTNVEAEALSDQGLVVGFASRPIRGEGGSLTAMIWDSASGKVTNLGCPEGYVGSHAQDINADGTRITGYVTGAEPARMQPCLWTWKASEKQWDMEVLQTRHLYNPFIMTGGSVISPDGKRIAASCTYEFINDRVISALYLWHETEEGWQQKLIRDSAFYLRDMNDAGLIAGVISKGVLRLPCYFDLDKKIKMIDLLPGDESGEACGVNAEGVIVGISDDPHGPVGGPQGFVWKAGQTTPLNLGDAPFSSALGINDAGQIAGMVDSVIDSPAGPIEKTLAFRAKKRDASATPK